jgi:hypothetical protein
MRGSAALAPSHQQRHTERKHAGTLAAVAFCASSGTIIVPACLVQSAAWCSMSVDPTPVHARGMQEIKSKRASARARACVAMPAWSVPGSHSARRPCMRWKRTMQSCSVANMAWPMCSRPVTFGGGMAAHGARRQQRAAQGARLLVGGVVVVGVRMEHHGPSIT